MIPIAHYLFAVAFSGIYSKKSWQEWADKQIMNLPIVQDWIYQVSLATNIDELSKALGDKLIEERNTDTNIPLISDAIIGYYYLEYLSGKITLKELLNKSGQEADGGEASVECEQFYSILNEIEKNNRVTLNRHFVEDIEILYEPFKVIAEHQKRKLEEF